MLGLPWSPREHCSFPRRGRHLPQRLESTWFLMLLVPAGWPASLRSPSDMAAADRCSVVSGVSSGSVSAAAAAAAAARRCAISYLRCQAIRGQIQRSAGRRRSAEPQPHPAQPRRSLRTDDGRHCALEVGGNAFPGRLALGLANVKD